MPVEKCPRSKIIKYVSKEIEIVITLLQNVSNSEVGGGDSDGHVGGYGVGGCGVSGCGFVGSGCAAGNGVV